jgi:3-hydroxy-9,10-secoandrosta-1,3,5(10)-triene-9,17-dione monooxygenase
MERDALALVPTVLITVERTMSTSSTSETVRPAQEEVDPVARARDLVPLLRANSLAAEKLGRLPTEIAETLREAGFFTLQQPRSLGGLEAGPRTTLDVYRELGRGSGSAAWVSMILSGSAYAASLFGERARDEVWGPDPLAAVCSRFIPGGTSRAVAGGVVVSARYQPLSGVHHAGWVLGGVPMVTATGPAAGPAGLAGSSTAADSLLVLVPISDVTIVNTWQVAGMQGTGSDTVVLEEVFVPNHRIISLATLFGGGYAANHPTERLAAASVRSFVAVTTIGPLLGMAETALEQTLAGLRDSGSAAAAGRSEPRIRLAVGRAASLIDTAILHAYRAADDVEEGIRSGEQLSPALHARIRMDIGTAAQRTREAVNLLLDAGGPRSFSLSNPVQQIWRNIETASRHTLLAPDRALDFYVDDLLGPS